MGRVKFSDVDHYGGSGNGGSYFKLENDKDVARVRFMIDGEEGLDDITFAVHKLKIDGKYKTVNCLREYNEPVDKCPFCQEYANVNLKFFVPLYNIDADEVQIWERGRTFAAQLSSNISRYGTGKKGPLVSHIFEIERNGKANDMKTTYGIFEVEQDDTRLEDLPEVPEILGRYVMDKSFDDMNYYLDEGEFPPEDDADDEPIRRRGKEDEFMNPPEDEEPPFEEEKESRRSTREVRARTDDNRRTPSNTSRRRQF